MYLGCRKFKIMKIIYLGFSIRVLIAIYNGFFGPSLGAEQDAVKFSEAAILYANGKEHIFHNTYGPRSYSILLSWIYKFTYESIFVGCLFSCFAWFLSAILILKSTKLLKFSETNILFCLIIYSFLPSSIMLTSVTLREPIQLLFINLGFYFLIKFYISFQKKNFKTIYFEKFLKQKKNKKLSLFKNFYRKKIDKVYLILKYIYNLKIINLIKITKIKGLFKKNYILYKLKNIANTETVCFTFFLIFLFISALFHRAILVFTSFSILIVFSAILLQVLKKFIKRINLFMVLIIVTPISFYVLTLSLGILKVDIQEQLFFTLSRIIQSQINGHHVARATYLDAEIFFNLWDIINYSIISFINYQLQPFPSSISNFLDYVLFTENILRFYFILICGIYIFVKNLTNKNLYIIIFINYLFLEFIWGLGTVNYGTAIRHHIPGMGLLLLCYFNLSTIYEKK